MIKFNLEIRLQQIKDSIEILKENITEFNDLPYFRDLYNDKLKFCIIEKKCIENILNEI